LEHPQQVLGLRPYLEQIPLLGLLASLALALVLLAFLLDHLALALVSPAR
jgi:hypothetical protein